MKLKELFTRTRDLKEAEQQDTPEYLEAFTEMSKTFEIVKELERQKLAQESNIVQEQVLNQNNNLNEAAAIPQYEELV